MPICRFCDIAYMDGESHSCHKYYWKWSAFKRVRVQMPSSETDSDEPLPPYVWVSPTLYYSGLRSKDARPVSSTGRHRLGTRLASAFRRVLRKISCEVGG